VKHRATASFKNTSHDQAAHGEPGDGPPLSRINLAREFTGDLVGKSTAELLACTSGPDRFGYVGVDRFTGRLKGRSGSFVFQHGGMHDKGTLRPFGYVVAGSGTDELKGLWGAVRIAVAPAGAHTIELDYDFEKWSEETGR